jgi:hydrogen peroxide-dependent heme synthase
VKVADFPPVPLTLEGSSLLHQFFRFDWKAWRGCAPTERARIADEAAAALKKLERSGSDGPVRSAVYSQLGHKGDLMLVHFRDSLEELNQVELDLAQTELYGYLDQRHSYVSIVELGLYESSRKTYEAAAEKGFAAHSPEWNAEVKSTLDRQAEAMKTRLFPAVPDAKYLSFYPMDRKRDELKNWYQVEFAERQRMMHEHGLIGRRYAGQVQQIISGSIGFDDWEWGVDLFAEDPLVFKKLIYEMRFDQVSAVYALFGQFFIGVRLPVEKLGGWLAGKL